MDQTLFSAKVVRREFILAVGARKGTWQRSTDFGGRVLRKKGNVE
jgi:hypothetical protein